MTTAIRLIQNGRVIDPLAKSDVVRDIYIDANGQISDPPPDSLDESDIVDASGHWVIPGVVDLCARFREPGEEHKADIQSESLAALSSGITSVCLPPDTIPVVDTPAIIDLIKHRAQKQLTPRFYILGAMSLKLAGTQLSEFAALKAAGCVGVSNALYPIANNQFMRHIMEYALSHDLKVFLNPLEGDLANQGCAHEGPVSTRMGLPTIPSASEVIAISRDLALIEATGVSAHFGRISTAQGVALIADAKQRGLKVTADTAAHQLFLTENDILGFNANCHVIPPLRSQNDKQALRQAVKEGVINAICSDHQPHEADAKQRPFAQTAPGISSLESLLPLVLRLVEEGVLGLMEAVGVITCGPAQAMGITAGHLGKGAVADITIIDPQFKWNCDTKQWASRGKNSPLDGWFFQGRGIKTLLAGQLIYCLTTDS